MTTIFLVIHIILAVALVVVVLLQRSDGGALGGLGGGGFAGVMSGRQSANMLTRVTSFVAAAFIGTSLILAILATRESGTKSLIDQVDSPEPGAVSTETEPALPALPAVPLTDE